MADGDTLREAVQAAGLEAAGPRVGAAARVLERELAEERAILAEVVERVPVGIALFWGRELRHRLVNRRYHELLPIADEVIGRTLDEVFPEQAPLIHDLVDPVFDTGEPVTLDDLPLGGEPGGPPVEERFYSATMVPVPAEEGQIAGVLAVFSETTERVQERRQLEERLIVEHEIADTLETSLLPAELPALERLELEARFIPAGERNRVGGDFYDVLEDGDGVMIILGDVAGKGPEAAADTARVRHTLRALALHEHRPARLLEQLNTTFVAQGAQRMCTVICARVEPLSTAKRLIVASAGHPRPLLVRRGRAAREIGAANPMIGLVASHGYREKTIRLRARDRVVFYSDGLTDAQAPARLITSEELRGAVSGREMLPLGRLLDNVIGWASGPSPRDDIAVLALERH